MDRLPLTTLLAEKAGCALGLHSVLLGALAVAAPAAAGSATSLVVGALLIGGGIARSIFAFDGKALGRGALPALYGGLPFLAGIAVLAEPLLGLAALSILMASGFVADGVVSIASAARMGDGAGRGGLVVSGIVGLALASMILVDGPLSGAWAFGAVAGAHLVVSGASMVCVGAAWRSGGAAGRGRDEGVEAAWA